MEKFIIFLVNYATELCLWLGVTGLVLLFLDVAHVIKLRKECTQTINAVCSDVRIRESGLVRKKKEYSPVFNVTFNDTSYTHEGKYFFDENFWEKGKSYKILLNPNNPEVYLYPGFLGMNYSRIFLEVLVISIGVAGVLF